MAGAAGKKHVSLYARCVPACNSLSHGGAADATPGDARRGAHSWHTAGTPRTRQHHDPCFRLLFLVRDSAVLSVHRGSAEEL
eukprot:6197622-Prymnesium_polylepis.1